MASNQGFSTRIPQTGLVLDMEDTKLPSNWNRRSCTVRVDLRHQQGDEAEELMNITKEKSKERSPWTARCDQMPVCPLWYITADRTAWSSPTEPDSSVTLGSVRLRTWPKSLMTGPSRSHGESRQTSPGKSGRPIGSESLRVWLRRCSCESWLKRPQNYTSL